QDELLRLRPRTGEVDGVDLVRRRDGVQDAAHRRLVDRAWSAADVVDQPLHVAKPTEVGLTRGLPWRLEAGDALAAEQAPDLADDLRLAEWVGLERADLLREAELEGLVGGADGGVERCLVARGHLRDHAVDSRRQVGRGTGDASSSYAWRGR